MTAEPARRAMTAAELEAAFEAVPHDQVAEIIDGELIASPRPALRYAGFASLLSGELHGPFRLGHGGPGGWILLFEPELHLGRRPDKLVPDLAGWRRERMPELPDEAATMLPPDWVCEVLSPSTERLDRVRKMRIYAREGIAHVWLANPLIQTLEVYRLEGAHFGLIASHEGDDKVRAEPFEAIELDLALLWAR